jgi:hypothetical protein
MRGLMVPLTVCTLLCAAAYAGDTVSPTLIAYEDHPDATLTLQGGGVAAGIGYTWGHGELTYRESAHRFSINGISVVDVGATDLAAAGKIYNLKNLADFSGSYVALGAGITVTGGGTAVYLENEHGVVIKLISTEAGLKFTLSADGVHIALKG